jgi:hypothetical protein
MTRYTFDFRKLTLGDIERGQNPDIGDVLLVLDRLCVGGILHLPLREVLDSVVPQYLRAFDQWYKRGAVRDLFARPQVYDAPTPDDSTLRDLLDGIEGL